MMSDIVCLKWPEFPVPHGFFGCTGGVSTSPYASLNMGPGRGDDLLNIAENKKRILQYMFPDQGHVKMFIPRQEHTSDVFVLKDPAFLEAKPADAIVTRCRGILLGITTADCGPILFYDPTCKVAGVAHAGWRGAALGVIENTLMSMISLGASYETIIAVLGPTIVPDNYEVKKDFCSELEEQDHEALSFIQKKLDAAYHFDLPGYILHRLRKKLLFVYSVDQDTFSGPFFSRRRALKEGKDRFGCGLSALFCP